MSARAGVLRDADSLAQAAAAAAVIPAAPATDSIDGWELSNLGAVARALIAAATARAETRGAHNRRDFPDRSPDFEHHIVVG